MAGELFHWDLRTRRCRHRHADAGMSPITCIDYSETVRTNGSRLQASLLNSFGTAGLSTAFERLYSAASERAYSTHFSRPLLTVSFPTQGQFLAAGSRSGVVNVYDVSAPLDGKQPKPAATVDNLVTPVGSVRFNHDAQVRPRPSCRRLFSIPSLLAYLLSLACKGLFSAAF